MDTNLTAPEQTQDIESEIHALRARAAAIAAARVQREEATAVTDELAKARRDLADEEAIEKAIAEHGRIDEKIAVVRSALGVVIVKRPSAMRFKKLQDQGADFSSTEVERFVRPSLLYPDPDRFDQMTEDLPAIWMDCCSAMFRLCGVRKDSVEKK